MTTLYATKVTAMYTVQQPDPDYVVNVMFTVQGTNGEYTAQIDGNIQLEVNHEQTDFIPYDQLTEADVLGWINAATNDQANYYANIDGQIESQINPPVTPQNTALPWATEA